MGGRGRKKSDPARTPAYTLEEIRTQFVDVPHIDATGSAIRDADALEYSIADIRNVIARLTVTWLLDLVGEGAVLAYAVDQRPAVRVRFEPSANRAATLTYAAGSEAFEQIRTGRTLRFEVPSRDHGVLRAQFDITGFEAAARRSMPLCSM